MTRLNGLELTPSDKIIFQSRAYQVLAKSFKNDHVAGAYLFYGPEGVGRWPTAITFAALLNCENVQNIDDIPTPCGECRNCRNIYNLSYESLKIALPIPPHENKEDKAMELTGEIIAEKKAEPFSLLSSAGSTNIPISIAREIKKNLAMRAPKDQKRVVIFYQMEKMKTASADALLKMIEEPPPDTVIILISVKPESLLPTIQSRSQKIKIDRIPTGLIEDYLRTNYEVSEKRLQLAARISSGSLGAALAMIGDDDDSSSGRSVHFLIFKSLFNESNPDTIEVMNEMINWRDKGEVEAMLKLWQSLLRDCNAFAFKNDEEDIVNVDFKAEIIKLAPRFTSAELGLAMIAEIKNSLADFRRNVHIQGAMTALVLKLKRFSNRS